MGRETELARIATEIHACQHCALWRTRTNAVVGEGALSARLMFIGEAPGYSEDQQGRPFVGKAGKVLEELLASIGLHRSEVYIANVLKCRPPGNRDPLPAELETCTPFLDAQLELVQPEVIATLGNFSLTYIFEKFGLHAKKEKISKIHGKVFTVRTITGVRTIVPLYHPAVAVYNPGMKQPLLEDFQVLRALLSSG